MIVRHQTDISIITRKFRFRTIACVQFTDQFIIQLAGPDSVKHGKKTGIRLAIDML
ncbi:MAG: hypothetical protein H9789_00540 [Candidatus Paraprevotella stercoravium]|uniref:Uncharacterized protein n=1 Tax=Candidatus Paraprevotella stercoravium TaxID=2838725 RepID=A0A9E2NZW7_9BACT|nr:hypothetical protein [Candidatus Paraprevotella stercoravium]